MWEKTEKRESSLVNEKKDSKSNVIGFIGDDFYETVLLLTFVVRNMNKSILLIDYSEERKLVSCIPKPLEVDIEKDVLSYKGIEYTSQKLISNKNYDFIFYYYGYSDCNIKCDKLILITNQEIFTQRKLLKYLSGCTFKTNHVSLLLHDIVTNADNEQIYKKVNFLVPVDSYYEIELDYQIVTNRIRCQKGTLLFRRTPKQIRRLIEEIFISAYPECNVKDLRKAYVYAKGGKINDNTVLEHASWSI